MGVNELGGFGRYSPLLLPSAKCHMRMSWMSISLLIADTFVEHAKRSRTVMAQFY